MLRRTAPIMAVLCLALASPASAEGLGVMDRDRPEYDAKGLPLGGFRLRPKLDVGVAYDDNVFRTDPSTGHDIYYTVTPSFSLESEWSRHRLELSGALTHSWYQTHDSENATDWNLAATGRVDILRGSYIDGETSYAIRHEPRYSPDEPGNAAESTRYAQFHAASSVTYQPNRFGIRVGANYDRFDFDPTLLNPPPGGVFALGSPVCETSLLPTRTCSNDDRNERQFSAFAQVSYEFSPGYSAFLRTSVNDEKYDLTPDRNGFNRDSRTYRADLGAEFFATHLIRGEVFAGYVNQRFQKQEASTPDLPDVSGFDYSVNLDWFATQLMTFHLRIARMLNDTTIAGASVSDDARASLGLDYELLRNVLVHAGVDYTRSNFEGSCLRSETPPNCTSRVDELVGAGISAEYLINEYMSANAGYRWSRRDSNVAEANFTDNTFLLGLRFQL